MDRLVIGIFSSNADAEQVILNLQTIGFNPKEISIITKESSFTPDKASPSNKAADSTLKGLTAGGVVGALAGLLVGVGAIAIPGIGAIFISGPLASALGITGAAATTISGAVTGALAGGIVGGLVGLGVPESEAKLYEKHLSQGAILLAVPTPKSRIEIIVDIMKDFNALQVSTINTVP